MDEIVKTEHQVSIIRNMDDAERAARSMVASHFFADSKEAAQAVVKILAGQELGFGPFASMTGVNIIQNKPVLAANLMAAAVKRQGKYNYRITRMDDTGCELTFYEGKEAVGISKFDKADAERAGLLGKDNWKKYPRNMYFARALSNGQKWYAPDVFNGATVYTPDEFDVPVDEEGNAVIDAKVIDTPVPEPPRPPRTERPYDPEVLKERIAQSASAIRSEIAEGKRKGCTDRDRQILAAALGNVLIHSTERYELCQWLVGVASTKKMAADQVLALLKWLNVQTFDDVPSEICHKEAVTAHNAALIAGGQQTMEIPDAKPQ